MSLSTLELAVMRANANDYLPNTAVIHRLTQASDGQGGFTDTWAAAGTVSCRISPSGGGERSVAEKLANVSSWTVTLPHSTVVTTADRLVIGSRTLRIDAMMAPHSWETARRVVCTEIT